MLLPLDLILALLASCTAYTNHVVSRSARIAPPSITRLSMVKTSQSIEEIKEGNEQLRQEIKELKAEALRRLLALEENLGVSRNTNLEKEQAKSSLIVVDAIEDEGLLPAPPPIVIKSSSDSKKRKGVGDLLDESVWKVSLSIGREPGKSSNFCA
jgi:uncharacterized OsmC-like protein